MTREGVSSGGVHRVLNDSGLGSVATRVQSGGTAAAAVSTRPPEAHVEAEKIEGQNPQPPHKRPVREHF
jgi:hypothetical protein